MVGTLQLSTRPGPRGGTRSKRRSLRRRETPAREFEHKFKWSCETRFKTRCPSCHETTMTVLHTFPCCGSCKASGWPAIVSHPRRLPHACRTRAMRLDITRLTSVLFRADPTKVRGGPDNPRTEPPSSRRTHSGVNQRNRSRNPRVRAEGHAPTARCTPWRTHSRSPTARA